MVLDYPLIVWVDGVVVVQEGAMAHRRIAHERLGCAASRERCSVLEELFWLIVQDPVMVLPKPIDASAKEEPAWPPLSMVKASLLLRDSPKLAEFDILARLG